MLSDGDQYRLVIRRSVDAGNAVDTDWETVGDAGRENSVDGSIIDTLEEGKCSWSGRCGLSDVLEFLNNKVCVASNVAILVNTTM